jgi:exodeoxyribonuclease X
VIICILDVETTGLEATTHRVVEVAAVPVSLAGQTWEIGGGWASLVNPGRPIPPEASGVHHIVDSDVLHAPDLDKALEQVLPERFDVVGGHNCRFDRDFMPEWLKEKRWLDTYRCAMHIWPDAPDFKNGTLFYYSGCMKSDVGRSHSALFDAKMTAHVLTKLLAERDVDELCRLSTKAVLLKKVGFGKHFGELWTDVPTSYLHWASGVPDFDPDVKFTVKRELERRSAL